MATPIAGESGPNGFEIAKFAVQIVGVVVVAVALVFNGRGVSAAKDAVQATNRQLSEAKYASVYQHQLDLWRFAADHPDLAPYVLGGKRTTDAITSQAKLDASRLAALDSALDFYAYIFSQLAPRDGNGRLRVPGLRVSPADKPRDLSKAAWAEWVTWASTIVQGFEAAPDLCPKLIASRDAYELAFFSAVQAAIQC